MPKILIIKTSSLGDVVHNLPVVTDIFAHDPQATVDWAVEASFSDIPRLHPRVRRIISVALRRWRGVWWQAATWREIRQFTRELRTDAYDLVLDTQGLFKSAVLAKFARAPSAGQDASTAREWFAALLYDRVFHVTRGQHAVVRNRDLAAQALGYAFPQTPPDYGIEAPHETLPPELHQPYVVCLHGASRASKHWPKVYWMSLVRELAHRGRTPALPWADAAERDRALAIVESVPGAVVLPRLPLRRLAMVLGSAQGVVGVDTGLIHLAAALRRPTVALYTDTSPLLTGVYPSDERLGINLGDKDHIPTPSEVLRALARLGIG